MVEHNAQNQENDADLPDALAGDLAELYRTPVVVDRSVDELVLARAREHVATYRGRRRRTLVWSWGGAGAAIAAMVTVGALLWGLRSGAPSELTAPRLVATIKEDIDRSGRVDILDAFALARHIDAGHSMQSQWDINDDGSINRVDVDAVAQVAVRLPGGPQS